MVSLVVADVSHPVPLLVQEALGLEENLLVGLLLGDAAGEVGRVGVDLFVVQSVGVSMRPIYGSISFVCMSWSETCHGYEAVCFDPVYPNEML